MSLPVREEPQRYAPVRNLMLYLTEECNLRCTYCFVKKEPRFMTRETALRTVDWYLQRSVSGGLEQLAISFFGGEPFLAVERMQEVVDYAQLRRTNVEKAFQFAATTNGTLANERVEKVIRKANMALLVSIDGGRRHSRFRPMVSGRESYDLVAKYLPKLARWASHCTARLTFTPENLDLVEAVRDVLALAPVGIALAPVVEADWTGREEALERAYEELGDWFLHEFAHGRRPPLEVTWELMRAYEGNLQCQSRPAKSCPLGTSLLAVDARGNVLPCHRFLHQPKDRLGLVEAEHLPAERWRYVHLRTLEIPECEKCEARTVCGGGCRAVALQAGYGLEGVHPNHCVLLRAHMRMVRRIHQCIAETQFYKQILNVKRVGSDILAELATLGS